MAAPAGGQSLSDSQQASILQADAILPTLPDEVESTPPDPWAQAAAQLPPRGDIPARAAQPVHAEPPVYHIVADDDAGDLPDFNIH
eukprot:9064066-Pyramimonas_sp.AAC.1